MKKTNNRLNIKKYTYLIIFSIILSIATSTFAISYASNGMPNPASLPNYNNSKGWSNWSQLAGAELKWGMSPNNPDLNIGCVATTRARICASHGMNIIPTELPVESYSDTPGKWTATLNPTLTNNLGNSTSVNERIKKAIPIIKKIQSQGEEADLRIQDGPNASDGHTMEVDQVINNQIYVFDPAVGSPWNHAQGASHVVKFIGVTAIKPDNNNPVREKYTYSAVRALFNGNGTILPHPGQTSAPTGNDAKGDNANSTNNASNSEQKPNNTNNNLNNAESTNDNNSSGNNAKEIKLAPLFAPFVTPVRMGGESQENTGILQLFSNIQLMDFSSGILTSIYSWLSPVALIMLLIMVVYSILGLLLYLIDSATDGVLTNVFNKSELSRKIFLPQGNFFGINVFHPIKVIIIKQIVIILLLTSVITGVYLNFFILILHIVMNGI